MNQPSQLKWGSHFAWTEKKRAQVLCILSEKDKIQQYECDDTQVDNI